jgi:hypothetical protein
MPWQEMAICSKCAERSDMTKIGSYARNNIDKMLREVLTGCRSVNFPSQ